ncbi:MAG TPA: hypothetical protein VHQ24_04275 [Lachnospiraceae bacterium]|nr:hypothetical protein [Lachnospiraceae bacterium]
MEFHRKYSVPVLIFEPRLIGGLLGEMGYSNVRYGDYLQQGELYRKHKDEFKPNRISVLGILEKLKEQYELKELYSEVIEEQVKSNVYECPTLARCITSLSDMEVHIYEIIYKQERLILCTEYNSNYICVSMPNVEEEIQEHRKSIDNFINMYFHI